MEATEPFVSHHPAGYFGVAYMAEAEVQRSLRIGPRLLPQYIDQISCDAWQLLRGRKMEEQQNHIENKGGY